MATDLERGRGRLLVLGNATERRRSAQALRDAGFQVEESESAGSAEALQGSAAELMVLVTGESEPGREQVRFSGAALLALDVVGPGDLEQLSARVDQALRLRRAAEREATARSRLEVLSDLGRIGVSTLPLSDRLHGAITRIAVAFDADRCSVVLSEGALGRVVVSAAPEYPGGYDGAVNLARYPEIRKALETREPVHVRDALEDPLMEEVHDFIAPLDVRSLLVQPLLALGEPLGVLFLRRAGRIGAFGPEEVDFAAVLSTPLAAMVHTARLHAALRRQRDELESAYVDRYRELIDANRRLKELNRFKDETLAVCSHDLRGPLNVLLGHARLLDDAELEVQEAASTRVILRQGRRLLELVESVLDRGRGEASQLALVPARLDLSEICRELASEQEIIAAGRGVSIEVEVAPRIELLADRVKLRQILQNLLGNALSHAREGGRVCVRASVVERPDGAVARVEVADDGTGIPIDELPAIFERYRHGPSGVGLGLAICRELVELHGGEIWAESGPGRGTTFSFTVPLSDVQLPGQGLNPAPTQKPRILLVEDEPEIAVITAELLGSRYRVDLARDGAEAVARARALAPDLVLMDVFLPRVDGLDAAAALKAAPDTRDIPVILVSAHQGVAEKVRALDLGAVDYLAKPFQVKELMARVEAALARRGAGRGAEPDGELPAALDEATGLLARATFLRRLEEELARARRDGWPLSIAIFELGATPGLPVLAAAADVLRTGLPHCDLLAHLGHGQLAACLAKDSASAARGACERVARELASATGSGQVRLGVVDAGEGTSLEDLLQQASRKALSTTALCE